MTNERFIFEQDVRERSKMKTGAFHKKNGSKSRKCTMPSDHLTPTQRKKLSGECMSIKMNEPYYDWKSFKDLSTETQRNYILGLVVDHQARSKDVAEMLGVSANTFSAYCAKFNPRIKFISGRNMDEKWLDFITKPAPVAPAMMTTDDMIQILAGADIIEKNDISEPVEIVKKVSEEPVAEEVPKKVSGYSAMVKMSLDLKGTKEEIMQMIDAILGADCSYIMSLKISNTAHMEEQIGGVA